MIYFVANPAYCHDEAYYHKSENHIISVVCITHILRFRADREHKKLAVASHLTEMFSLLE